MKKIINGYEKTTETDYERLEKDFNERKIRLTRMALINGKIYYETV